VPVTVYGIGAHCRKRVAATHVVADGKVYLRKDCPICIANIPSMGFEFHPPLSYFDHAASAKEG